MGNLMLVPLALSLVFGLVLGLGKFSSDKQLAQCSVLASGLISLSALPCLYFSYGQHITLLYLGENLRIRFTVDGLSVIFGGMVCVLWPIATYYAKTYMSHEGKFRRFFTFYLLTFGVVLGLAFSDNLFTLYLFYELLTIVTLPLVSHSDKAKDRYAGKIYVAYMIFGASLTFAGMMLFISNVESFQFVFGGSTPNQLDSQLLWGYLLMFFGFGVKAGLFPFHNWLLSAGVAPTPVTALLHAVAVVKSGAFAIMRITYYLYRPEALAGTVVQEICVATALLTIFFGSYMAMRSQHLKRRLAYSTISQLSYIVLGTVTMSVMGLQAALLHLVFHGFTKIVLFYGVGNLLFANNVEMISQVRGYGKAMPGTFLPFFLCGLALIGVPPFGGFFSKYGLAHSLLVSEAPVAHLAVVILVLSAFFTGIYLFQIIYPVYLPGKDHVTDPTIQKAPKSMEVTMGLLTGVMILLSLFGAYLQKGIEFVLKVGV